MFIEELTREEIEEFNRWKFIMRGTRVFEVVRGEKAAPREEISEKPQEEIAETPEPAQDVTQQEQARPRPTARKAPPPRPPLAAVKKEEEILEKREEPKEPEGMGPFEKREEPHEEPQEGRDTWLALLLQAPEGKEPQEDSQRAQWTKATRENVFSPGHRGDSSSRTERAERPAARAAAPGGAPAGGTGDDESSRPPMEPREHEHAGGGAADHLSRELGILSVGTSA